MTTPQKVQEVLNKCEVVADAYLALEKLVAGKDAEIAALTEQNALLKEQLQSYMELSDKQAKAIESYEAALTAARQGNAVRDKEIQMLKERIDELKGKKTALWKKILMVAAGIFIGKAL